MKPVSSDVILPQIAPAPLRIAIVSPEASPETFIQSHILHLQHMVLLLSDGEQPTRSSDGRILKASNVRGKAWEAVQAALRGGSMRALLSRRIAALLKEHRVDVVLAEYGNTASAMIDACRIADVPLVAHFHGIDAHGSRYNGHYAELFGSAAKLVVVSRAMEQQLLALGAPREKVIFNCYGIDLDRFRKSDPAAVPPHFIAVGRFVEKKAPHLTILAFKEVVKALPAARLTMIGSGRLLETCHQLVKALELSAHIDLPGPLPSEEVAGRMMRSRAFVQHSVTTSDGDAEGTPLAVLEAMASGIPVIATRHTGIMDAVQHELQGLLCDPLDVRMMFAHMLLLARDQQLAARIGAHGRQRVETYYDVTVQVAKLQQILHSAVHGDRSA